ncbi:ATPase family AAA domain-containing protein 5 isoform X1 [Polypterus senegalus]|uniref:ATPase family AAA domain-containing protein 5 isoform X1 n=1 Tax=Polypterus senegalus TaxID=55291 RepID=UPI001962CE08|nr:ATPase family AAA domain-containing protein 5 isoform X1 [Polypterus senegalus]
MVSIVGMATLVEDFDTQDCKKRKKEGDHAPVKTITNYFMPMAKVEKAFSPPKSNNIMDYFKKTSPANNKHVVQEKVKENQEKHDVTVKDDKIPVKGVRSLRRGRNVIKKENSSKQLDSVEENSDEVSDVNNDSRDNGLTVGSRILGSETAALLAEICANSYDLQEDTNLNEQPKTALKSKTMKKTKKMQRKPQQLETSSKVLIKEPLENKDSNESPRVTLLPPHNECGKSVCNTSLDVSVNETSCLNDSIVTISFEDFLESQKEVDNLSSPDRSLIKSSDDKDGQKSSPSQVSPRTLTIQAQVHSLAAKSSGSKAQKKIASIFMKKRYVEADPVEVLQVDPPITKTAEQVSKRKSNVVVDEEALELSVIETSTSCLSKPKCTPAEKKQFMNVFKQPPLDVAKNKQKKVQRNPKVPMEKVPKELEVTENTTEETAVRNVLDSEVSGSRGNWSKGVQCVKETTSAQKGKSLKRKGKRNVGKVSSVDDVTPEVLEKTQKPEGRKSEEKEVLQEANLVCTVSSRRLTRGQAKSDAKNLTSLNKRNEENSDVCSSLAGDSPVQMSTPKTTKKGIYRSEMVTAPDEAQSPIRMRFTRVFPRRLLNSGGEDTETLLKKADAKKNTLKAKQLVEKAKAVQQSKCKTTQDKDVCLRRSSRARQQSKVTPDENSLVLIEDGDFSKEQRNGKKLRNLNEVLGKSKSKCSKDCTDSKVAPIFLGKKSTKPSVISIFDDSSRDESENSQDDEQFRAKREFLKSGLPDSFKKHIAKKAASELAFSQAAVSFRAVVHILQKQEGSKFWQLTWPESPFLRSLKDDPEMKEMNRHVMTLGEFTYAKSSWTPKTPVVEVSGWRVDLSEEMRQQLLEDIRLANPSFPVQKFFNWFLKRRTEHVLLPSVSELGKEANAPNNLPQNAGKRKRKSSVEKESKRSKPNMQDSDVIVIESDTAECVPVRVTRRSRGAKDEVAVQVSGKSRLSRSTRQKEQASVQCENEEIAVKVIQTETDKILEAKLEETAKEDVLWTEKYQPQQSSEIVGNCGAVKKLHSWLKEWKLRTDREESKNQTESKLKDKNDTWDIGDFKEDDSEEENDDFLCNTMLVTGPSGVGKTAAVYACAHELGFKVFEVNASSQRSGRQVLSQLKEATQSHQVDIQGVNTHKPAYFSNPSRSFSGSSTSPRKVNSPKKVVSSPRNSPQSNRRTGISKGGLAPTALEKFFKLGSRPAGKNEKIKSEREFKDKKQNHPKEKESSFEKVEALKTGLSEIKSSVFEEPNKKGATSLILFEEVDIIFDDDSGFWAAIKTFMATTKRPVILTTNDPYFSLKFDGCFEEVIFKMPDVSTVTTYLQLVCLAENLKTNVKDCATLLAWNNCDIRQSLLHLQFWIRSGGSNALVQQTCGQAPPSNEKLHHVPFCDQGSTESLLGLHNNKTSPDLLSFLKSKITSEEQLNDHIRMLAECQDMKLYFTYNNLEFLLPLPVKIIPACGDIPQTDNAREMEDTVHSPMEISKQEDNNQSPDPSPLKLSSRMKRKRMLCLRDDEDLFQSDSEDNFVTLSATHSTSCIEKNATIDLDLVKQQKERHERKPKTSSEKQSCVLVSKTLDSLADFLENVSFLDSSLYTEKNEKEGPYNNGVCCWSAAEIKNGLSDEARIENNVWWHSYSATKMKATVEALSFQRCHMQIDKALNGTLIQCIELGSDSTEEITLPLADHRLGVSLVQQAMCKPSLLRKRSEVMEAITSSRLFANSGSRQVIAVDCLPVLRLICKAEKLREQCKLKRRFMHYLEGIHFNFPRPILDAMAAGFP